MIRKRHLERGKAVVVPVRRGKGGDCTPTPPYLVAGLYGIAHLGSTRLRRDEVDLKQGIVTVKESKRHRLRLVPLHPSTGPPLQGNRKRSSHAKQTSLAKGAKTPRYED
jgi:hypothetical protein